MKTLVKLSAFFIFYWFLTSCHNGNSDSTGTKNQKVWTLIDGKEWKSTNAFYSEENQRIFMTALSENSGFISFSINNIVAGTYDLADKTNSATINLGESIYKGISGKIVIKNREKDKITGEFSFKAVNSSDSTKFIEIAKGAFDDILLDKQNLTDQIIISRSKVMTFSSESGEVKNEETPVEIMYYENVMSFKYKDKDDKSFTVKIKRVEKNGAGILFYTDDAKVENISIDASNKDQTTVWLKNGNTITYF